jgi:hypothetical protein
MWRRLVIALTFTLASQAQISSPATGSVEGTVLDGEGKPLPGATVFVGTLAKGPRTKTDAGGRFRLNGLSAGNIGLLAYKESDGYPYDMFSFFLMPGEQIPKLDVAAGETVRGVVIHLGARAAYLKLEVTDESGLPVDSNLSFSRPDLGRYGDYRRSAKANDVILVPPVPFRLTIEAEDFEPWHYGGADWQTAKGLVRLKSGEVLALSIHLQRAPGTPNAAKQ